MGDSSSYMERRHGDSQAVLDSQAVSTLQERSPQNAQEYRRRGVMSATVSKAAVHKPEMSADRERQKAVG